MKIQTKQPGAWSDQATWGGTIPSPTDIVEINHQVNLDKHVGVAGMIINNRLTLDGTKDILLQSTGNIVVYGELAATPAANVNHTIRFTNVYENKFIGATDTVVESDIGLWVMGNGALELFGREKTAFVTQTLTSGYDSYIDLIQENWATDDLLLITPTERNKQNYDVLGITGIDPQLNGQYSRVKLSQSMSSHARIAGLGPVVANLTRNLCIEGSGFGYSHVFIKSTSVQNIQYVQFRYMGPRKDRSGDGVKELVTGRYALHFHHCDNGSVGSVVKGCVVRDCNSHSFVAHGSHGINMSNNIAYDVLETAFWYDVNHKTNDLVLDSNLVAKVGYVNRALDQDSGDAPTFGAGGFLLGFGDGNICTRNIVVGTSGDAREGAAYVWPELRDDNDNTKQLESPWTFVENRAHNCPAGISVWQNNNHHHVVKDTFIINCDVSIFHGAYQNHYLYLGGYVYGGYIELRASSATTNRVRFENMTIDAAGGNYCVIANEGPLTGVMPILFRNCVFRNFYKKAIIDQNPGPGIKRIDVVGCGIPPESYQVAKGAVSGEAIRVQELKQGVMMAYKITKSGQSDIALFAPQKWGTGNGLLATYYTPQFKGICLKRTEPNVNIFDITHPQIHYRVPSAFSARWTGKIQPQYSEAYTFICQAGGGVRLWINNQLIIDKWDERYPGDIKSKAIQLMAEQQYDFKLEYYNEDDRSLCLLDWQSPTLKREAIPMSQLYS